MIERLIFTALQQGLALFQAHPELVLDVFADYGLTAAEQTTITTLFSSTPPTIWHGYSQRDQPALPYWVIVLAGEQESERFIGDATLDEDDPEADDRGTEYTGSIWTHNYMVLSHAQNADICQYLYQVAKALIMLGRRGWVGDDYNLFNISLSGADVAPDQRYFPEPVFIRQLSVQCSGELSLPIHDSNLGKAWELAGLHVDQSGSPSDVGGVETLITPVTEWESDDGE